MKLSLLFQHSSVIIKLALVLNYRSSSYCWLFLPNHENNIVFVPYAYEISYPNNVDSFTQTVLVVFTQAE